MLHDQSMRVCVCCVPQWFAGKEDNVYRIAVSGKQTRRVRDVETDYTILLKSLVNFFFLLFVRLLKAIIAENDGDRETAAVVEIQRLWRGFRTRLVCIHSEYSVPYQHYIVHKLCSIYNITFINNQEEIKHHSRETSTR